MELSTTIIIWAPIGLLFLSTILGIIVERHTKDVCLKQFNGDFVILRMKDNQFIWGRLRVFPSCLELSYETPLPIGNGKSKSSYVLYNKKMAEIECIYRIAPPIGSKQHELWKKEIDGLRHTGIFKRIGRILRNLYGILRDAFSQSVGALFGLAKKSSKTMQQVGDADKRATEVGQSLMKILPHAYEPVFEAYLNSLVVVESQVADTIEETIGRLENYTVGYLLIRNISVPANSLPAELNPDEQSACDIIFPRSKAIIRHLAIDS